MTKQAKRCPVGRNNQIVFEFRLKLDGKLILNERIFKSNLRECCFINIIFHYHSYFQVPDCRLRIFYLNRIRETELYAPEP